MNMQTSIPTPADGAPFAIGTAAYPPGSNDLAFVVAVEVDKGPATFTLIAPGAAPMSRNRWTFTLANRRGYLSSPLSEHLARPMIERARNVPAIDAETAAEIYVDAKTKSEAAKAKRLQDMQESERRREESRAAVERFKPSWAKAAIIAELVEDKSDSMTDYFNSVTVRRVVLAWSRHKRDLFPEMRKAAALLPETATLSDAPESAEHREKWSMGGGYYLKAGYRHDNGWKVSKDSFSWMSFDDLEFTDEAKAGLSVADLGAAKSAAAEAVTPGDFFAAGRFTISEHVHSKKNFRMWIAELSERVERAEYDALLSAARELGGWYSRAWGQTPAGFAFKRKEAARQFVADNGGDTPQPGPGKSPQSDGGATKAPRASSPGLAEKLRSLADGMDSKIANCFADRLSNTPKRARQAAEARNEGTRLERAQKMLRALADCHEAGTVPNELEDVKSKAAVYELASEEMDRSGGYYDAGVGLGRPYPWADIGKPENASKAATLWALIETAADPEKAKAEDIARKVDALQFAKIPGYFPTPADLVARMIDAADLPAGARVLEPSAGSGAIADAVREAGHSVECIEHWTSLVALLRLKGHNVTDCDFFEIAPLSGEAFAPLAGASFDAVLMNPPFETGQDCAHVRHAWQFVKPGGALVAIMGAGVTFRQTNPHRECREWLEELGAEISEIPAGAFKPSGTGVSSVMVTLRKA